MNKTLPRHLLTLLTLLTLLVLLLAVACADPAADAPQAEVSEPAPAAEPAAAGPAVTYALSEDSKIGFVGSKVTGSHEGGFESFDGQVSVVGATVEGSSVEVTIDTTSLWSDNEKLTGHLKSADFFDVENHPVAAFVSTGIADNGDGTYTMSGLLDLHGVQKQISFPAAVELTDTGFTAQAEFAINRFDFEIKYAGKADDLIREDVLIKLDLRSASADDAAEAEETEAG